MLTSRLTRLLNRASAALLLAAAVLGAPPPTPVEVPVPRPAAAQAAPVPDTGSGTPQSAGSVARIPYAYTLDAATSVKTAVTAGAGSGRIMP